jgi:hypothetical protein
MISGGRVVDTLVGIGVAVIGVAILAVILYRGSQAPAVIKSAGGALTSILSNAFSGV